MSTQNTMVDYVALTNEVYALLVDAFGSADTRALNYWKSVWDITSRPYSPVTIDSIVNENLNRATQLTNLTVDELRSAGRESAEFAEKLLTEGAKVQDTALGSFRGLIDKYGYATYGGNSHLFADSQEGWILIDFAGSKRLWIAERIGPDEVRMS